MTEPKKILIKVFVLFLEVVLLSIRIIKNVVLPNRKRKGNILNSVFVFFVGTVEILNRFEYGIFQMKKIFQHKYVRQGVIIIGAFLFLLSSLEWTKRQGINVSDANYTSVQLPQKVSKSISFTKVTKATGCLTISCISVNPLANIFPLGDTPIYSTSVKRYLLIRSILI